MVQGRRVGGVPNIDGLPVRTVQIEAMGQSRGKDIHADGDEIAVVRNFVRDLRKFLFLPSDEFAAIKKFAVQLHLCVVVFVLVTHHPPDSRTMSKRGCGRNVVSR